MSYILALGCINGAGISVYDVVINVAWKEVKHFVNKNKYFR